MEGVKSNISIVSYSWTYIRTHVHKHSHTHTHTRIYTHIHAHVYTHTYRKRNCNLMTIAARTLWPAEHLPLISNGTSPTRTYTRTYTTYTNTLLVVNKKLNNISLLLNLVCGAWSMQNLIFIFHHSFFLLLIFNLFLYLFSSLHGSCKIGFYW